MSGKHIVILGGGFAGLQLAKKLKNTSFEITLIDQYNFHQFQPLFYQVATARLEPSSISFPLRKIFQKKENVHIRVARIISVDTINNKVTTEEGDFSFDYLVIAMGCRTNFFGNKNLEKYAYPMKSTTDAIALRNRILLNFEDALSDKIENKEAIMNIVVAGGGPTGVELAGSIIETKKKILPRDYPDMDFSKLNVYLIEGSAATLAAMSEISQRKSREYLERMGVQVWTDSLIDDYDGETVFIKGGRSIKSKTLIWAAGVTGNIPEGINKDVITRGNRITVDQYSRMINSQNIFAIGDVSYMETKGWEKGHPQLANVANNQAIHLAKNMKRLLVAKPMLAFEYKNPGTMATIGKRKAVVDLPSFSFQGFLAWLVWMFLHLMLILSVKNKLIIFINWAISYITDDTTLRLILLPTKKQIELTQKNRTHD